MNLSPRFELALPPILVWVKPPNYRAMSCWFPPLAAWQSSASMVLSSGG